MKFNQRQMHLNLFLMVYGHHEAAWRHPETNLDVISDFSYFKEVALKCEQAKLDSVFLADRLSISKNAAKYNATAGLEPITLLSALAAVTEKIGLIGTVSTSFNEPFNLARRFNSLDHISGGRAGWNIVTSGTDDEAQNFGMEKIIGHIERYERAKEFLEVTTKLWDSWEDDALIKSKANGIFADSNKVHPVNHRGKYYAVRGPLNISRSPQGRPVLIQAGSSEDGKDFAARFAEAVFTAQQTFEDARAFYGDLKSKLIDYGRTPADLKILPGICPVIGETEAEAKEKEAALHELTTPEYSLLQLSNRIGVDLSKFPLDGPLPDLSESEVNRGHQSRSHLIIDLARREQLTIRELLLRLAGGRGHHTISGTPEQIADLMQLWFEQDAADGFNVMPQLMKGGLEDFLYKVVPILQRRGLFRTEYTGHTLRHHYGLSRPESQFVQIPQL